MMEFEQRYIVVKESDDGTFRVGDHITLNPDGTISCRGQLGWIVKEDVPEATAGMEVDIDHQ